MPKKGHSKPKAPKSTSHDSSDRTRAKHSSGEPSGPSKKEDLPKNSFPLDENVKEQRKFKPRRIEENWDKYEEEPLEPKGQISESQLRNTGADFSTLATQCGAITSTFKFKDESEWEFNSVQSNQSTSVTDTSLSLDLQTIAESLNKIPLYKKLGLSSTLDSISEAGFSWHGDYFEDLKKEETEDAFSRKSQANRTLPDPQVSSWSFKGVEDYKQNVLVCLEKVFKAEVVSKDVEKDSGGVVDSDSKENTTIKETVLAKIGLEEDFVRTPIVKTSTDKSGFEDKPIDDYDDELDMLLSMSIPQAEIAKQKSPILKQDEKLIEKSERESEKAEKNEAAIESTQSSAEDNMILTRNEPKGSSPKADDLEDWLDELLK